MRPVRTSRYMSKFEAARLIGLRSLQLRGDPSVEVGANLEAVAKKEIREKKLAWAIRRYTPDGHEDVDARLLLLDKPTLQQLS